MNHPSSRHLSHDYEAYKGLSLRELFWIALIATPTTSVIFVIGGLLIDFPLAAGCVGFVVGFVLSITVCPKRFSRIKAGKPHGYLMKQTLLFCARIGLKQSPYIAHCGQWQKSRIVGEAHV